MILRKLQRKCDVDNSHYVKWDRTFDNELGRLCYLSGDSRLVLVSPLILSYSKNLIPNVNAFINNNLTINFALAFNSPIHNQLIEGLLLINMFF